MTNHLNNLYSVFSVKACHLKNGAPFVYINDVIVCILDIYNMVETHTFELFVDRYALAGEATKLKFENDI